MKNIFLVLFTLGFLVSAASAQQPQRQAPPKRSTTTQASSASTPTPPRPIRKDSIGRLADRIYDSTMNAVHGNGFMTSQEKKAAQLFFADSLAEAVLAPIAETDTSLMSLYVMAKTNILREMASNSIFPKDSSMMFATKALEYYDISIEKNFGDLGSDCVSASSLALDVLEDKEKALYYINIIIEKHPENTFPYMTKVRILREMNRITEACETLVKAKELGIFVDGLMQYLECDRYLR